MKRKGLFIIGILGFALLALVGYRFYNIAKNGVPQAKGGRGAGAASGKNGPPVGVAVVGKRTLQFEFEQVGSVESSQTVNIVSKSAGALLELRVRPGDSVKKGEILAKVDPAQAQAAVFKKQSDLASAQYTYYQQLSQQGLTGVQAVSTVSIAQADVSAAQAGVAKSRSVYVATVDQGQTTVAQSKAKLIGAQAQERETESAYAKSKAKYDRMLGLQRQGFASNADLQDAYQDVLAQYAAVDLQRANVKAAEKEVANAAAQARKDNVSALADIKTSRFNQVSKQATLNEAQAGSSKTAAYQQQLLAQKSLVDAAAADLHLSQLQLEDTVLRSPVDGFVTDRKLDLGAVTSVGTVILTVQSGGEVWVVSAFPQEVYSRVQKDQACQVTVDGVRNRVFAARVFSKDPAIDAASRQFNIRVKIDDPQHQVKPGMFARVRIKVGRPDPRLAIPNAALFDKDESKRTATVYKVEDGKIVVVTVHTGPSDSAYTAILGGLLEGDTVVVQTLAALKDGQEVEPQVTPLGTPTPVQTVSPSATPQAK